MALAGAKPSYYRCLLDVSQQFIESEWTGVLESSLHTIWKVVTDRGCIRASRVCEREGLLSAFALTRTCVSAVCAQFSLHFALLSFLFSCILVSKSDSPGYDGHAPGLCPQMSISMNLLMVFSID